MAETTVAAPVVKSGWKTTEAWLSFFALGALTWVLEQLVAAIPTIAAIPGIPGWTAPVFALAPIGIGYLLKRVVANYGQMRTDLKLEHANAATPATDKEAAAVVAKL
jgi:hypothetical protein